MSVAVFDKIDGKECVRSPHCKALALRPLPRGFFFGSLGR